MAASWIQDGRTDTNTSGLLHFLVTPDAQRLDVAQVTMVIDELTSEMAKLYGALSFRLEELTDADEQRKPRTRRFSLASELQTAGCRLSRRGVYRLDRESSSRLVS